jgi:inhibitor of KinA
MKARIFPLSESALTVEFGTRITPELNDLAIALSETLSGKPFPGFIEAAPAYSSVTVHFDPKVLSIGSKATQSALSVAKMYIEEALSVAKAGPSRPVRRHEIIFSVGKDSALDLDFVAAQCGLSTEDVIQRFTSRTYRVYMLGFLPGFAYMGDVDPAISVGRKENPRMRVPGGSVAIAGAQAGIYPFDSPGGWQVLGRTDLNLFTRNSQSPCIFEPGDEVRFIAT